MPEEDLVNLKAFLAQQSICWGRGAPGSQSVCHEGGGVRMAWSEAPERSDESPEVTGADALEHLSPGWTR